MFHTVIGASAKRGRQQARRAESLSGSIRQFLTPEVWKQAPQAAHAAGCRNDPRWSLQPLILTWAMMTWCAGQTDAERFLTVCTFYVRVHSPKRSAPEGTSAGSTRPWAASHDRLVGRRRGRALPTRAHLADRMVVDGWTAFGCDGTRLECPRTEQLEDDLGRASKPGSAPMLWITALVSLRTGVLWSWRLGTAKAGERQHLLDLLEDLPRLLWRGSCWSATPVTSAMN